MQIHQTNPVPAGRDRPRLLLVAPWYFPRNYGGAVQIYHQLLKRQRGFEAIVVTESVGGQPKILDQYDSELHQRDGYRIVRLGQILPCFPGLSRHPSVAAKAIRWFVAMRGRWRSLLEELQPDIVVCGAPGSCGWFMYTTASRLPVATYIHGELTTAVRRHPLPLFLRYGEKQLLKRAAINIAVSRFTASKAIELAGLSPNRVVTLLNFVDTELFHPAIDRDALRLRLGWGARQVLLSVCRLVPCKGIDLALRALADLHHSHRLSPDWLYVVAGTGGDLPMLRQLACDLGISDHLQFPGFVPHAELPALYGAADLFLLPNREIGGDTEGFGIVFLEANACGLPVIGGIAGGTEDAIAHEISGLRVNVEDRAELAGAIARLLSNDELRHRMGAAGQERADTQFGIDAAVRRFEEVLRGVVNSRRPNRDHDPLRS